MNIATSDRDSEPSADDPPIGAASMKPRYFTPLLTLIVPSAVIGFGVVIPGSCTARLKQLTVGFATTLLGACVSYWLGIRSVLSDRPHG
jgi:hypothetical protein